MTEPAIVSDTSPLNYLVLIDATPLFEDSMVRRVARMISQAPPPVHVDGRPIGKLPVRLRMLPRALRVLA